MDSEMQLLEEYLESEHKGLVYIDDQKRIQAYSRRAKEITGMILEADGCHPAGRIAKGDIVIIADNEIGNDDDMTVEDLELINITDNKLKPGDALVAVGVYKNKKTKPQYKYVSAYNPNGAFQLKTNYFGFDLISTVNFARHRMEITVNGELYAMKYFEAIGFMVIIDGITGKVKFFQARGCGVRDEEIGKILRGKHFLEKNRRDTCGDMVLPIDFTLQDIFGEKEIVTHITNMLQQENGGYESGIFKIYNRPAFCALIRMKRQGGYGGVCVVLQDLIDLEDVRKERANIIGLLEKEQKRMQRLRDSSVNDLTAPDLENFIGEDPSIREVKRLAYKASRMKFNVIITGESGTGKSLLAREIHRLWDKNAPFVEVNCNAIAPSLFESELFGYEAGAFTGAAAGGRSGFFEEAGGGTIFLDEIGDIPLEIQAKLLHVLQNKQIYRVGSSKAIDIDVRVITATNSDLAEAVKKGCFRKDLYYRINVFPVRIPPLRQRRADLYALINFILDKKCREFQMDYKLLSEEALHEMMNYSWFGNVRELENVIERAVTICDSPIIYSDHILTEEEEKGERTLKMRLLETEKKIISEVYERCRKDKQRVMAELGLCKSALYEKLKKFDIE